MKEKKQLILIGAVVLAVIVLVVVCVFVRKQTREPLEGMNSGKADRMGIDYGGDFNEFQYINEETRETSEETEQLSQDEMEALDKKIREEFEKKTNGAENIEKLEKLEIDNVNIDSEDTDAEEKPDESDGFTAEQWKEAEDDEDIEIVIQGKPTEGYAEYEVVCDVATQADADAIAAQIGGTVKECHDGMAVIMIKENVDELLARLEQQGSSLELYRHYYISAP